MITFEEFLNDLPRKIKVYNLALDKFEILTLLENRDRYISGNNSSGSGYLYHYWSLDKVYASAVDSKDNTPLYVKKIETRAVGVVLRKKEYAGERS